MRKTNSNDFSGNRLTISTAGLQAMLSCGYQTAVKIGANAGAKIKIGRRVLWNIAKIEQYLESLVGE